MNGDDRWVMDPIGLQLWELPLFSPFWLKWPPKHDKPNHPSTVKTYHAHHDVQKATAAPLPKIIIKRINNPQQLFGKTIHNHTRS
jgi:hypothetical protein